MSAPIGKIVSYAFSVSWWHFLDTPESPNKLKRNISFVSNKSAFECVDGRKKMASRRLSSASMLSNSSSEGSLRTFSPILIPNSGIETPLSFGLQSLSITASVPKDKKSNLPWGFSQLFGVVVLDRLCVCIYCIQRFWIPPLGIASV